MVKFIRSLLFTLTLMLVMASAQAQTYNSGSTGANGAFPPASLPTGTSYIVLNLGTGGLTYYNSSNVSLGTASVSSPDAQGIYNFTTFTLASGVTLYLTPDSLNRPARFLASGDMTISGLFTANGQVSSQTANSLPGQGGAGGPGGFRGGDSGYWTGTAYTVGAPGSGPAGGQGAPVVNDYGRGGLLVVSNPLQIPLWGGSGGGGSPGFLCGFSTNASGGGGGGGALLLASSGTITLNGGIQAFGGSSPGISNCGNPGGGGSGGVVRVVAATIAGSGTINVFGGGGNYPGGPGFVRTEAYTNSIAPDKVVGSTGPNGYIRSLTPTTAIPSGQPSITVTSIGGLTAPSGGNGGYVTPPDISFSTTLWNVNYLGIPRDAQ